MEPVGITWERVGVAITVFFGVWFAFLFGYLILSPPPHDNFWIGYLGGMIGFLLAQWVMFAPTYRARRHGTAMNQRIRAR